MARAVLAGRESAVGKRIGGATPFMANPREIIGVVSDVRSAGNFDDVEGRFQLYRALAQWNHRSATIALRSPHRARGARAGPAPRRRRDRSRPGRLPRRTPCAPKSARASARSTPPLTRWWLRLLGVLLAAVGIYGVIANSVVQRTNEIGIRLALGAQVRDILALILGGGLRLTLFGAALGLAGALGVARLLRSISPEFSAADPGLTAAVTVFFVLVATFACWLPARRATKVDPMAALRAE